MSPLSPLYHPLAELSYHASDGNRQPSIVVPTADQQAILNSQAWPIPAHYLPPTWKPTPAM